MSDDHGTEGAQHDHHDDEHIEHDDPGRDSILERRSRDESLAAVLEAEPTLLGDPLLIVGTTVMTDTGDFADVVALDADAAVHVISVAAGVADGHSVEGLTKLSSWAAPLEVHDVRGIFDAYHEDVSLEAAFEDQFAASLPGELTSEPHATIVAAALDDDAEQELDRISWTTDRVHAFAYQEVVDGEDMYIVTKRLV